MNRLRGQCMCRSVTYEVEDEFEYALNCHCSDCRRATGSAFKSLAGIELEKLRLVEGQDITMIYGDDFAHDWHCGKCGSLLYSVVREGKYAHVAWAHLLTAPVSAHRSIFSLAPRHHGSTLPMTCHNTMVMDDQRS